MSFVARTLILQTAVGITHIVWYAWDNRGPWIHLYLVGPDFFTPTAAGIAFGEVVQWLERSSVSCSSEPDGSWQCLLVADDGTSRYIVWNPIANTTLNISDTWKVSHIHDLGGNVIPINNGQVTLTPEPVLLEP